LVSGSRPVADLSRELATYGWDSEEELVTVAPADVIRVLEEYTAGRRLASDVRAWAEAIEGRDDIGLAAADEEVLRDTIFELANPELGHALTPLLAQQLLRKLQV
jgi:hypothetical protein